MKKFLSLALAAMMVLTCAFALAEQAAEAQVWYLLSVAVNGTEVSAADANSQGTLTLNPDGTGALVIVSNGQTQETPLTYVWKDTTLVITAEGNEVTAATDEKGHITLTVGASTLTLTKDQAEVPTEATGNSVQHTITFINTTGQTVTSLKLGNAADSNMSEVLKEPLPDGMNYELTLTLPEALANIVMVMDYTTDGGLTGHLDNIPFDNVEIKLYVEAK